MESDIVKDFVAFVSNVMLTVPEIEQPLWQVRGMACLRRQTSSSLPAYGLYILKICIFFITITLHTILCADEHNRGGRERVGEDT